MIHYQQYPQSKLPVKLNSVNFDGVFNNMKHHQDPSQPTPQNMNTGKPLSGVQGFGINGPLQMGGGDMQGLI